MRDAKRFSMRPSVLRRSHLLVSRVSTIFCHSHPLNDFFLLLCKDYGMTRIYQEELKRVVRENKIWIPKRRAEMFICGVEFNRLTSPSTRDSSGRGICSHPLQTLRGFRNIVKFICSNFGLYITYIHFASLSKN